jgi:hypothetical protein
MEKTIVERLKELIKECQDLQEDTWDFSNKIGRINIETGHFLLNKELEKEIDEGDLADSYEEEKYEKRADR